MSIKVQSWVYQDSEARGNERLVLLAIADEANDDGTNAYPGIATIAHKARLNERTTMRCLDRLEEAGRLKVVRPERKGRGYSNTYVVVMQEPGAQSVKGDTLSPLEDGEGEQPSACPPAGERVTEDRARPRKTAQSYLNGCRPIDPTTQEQPHLSPAPISAALPTLPLPASAQAPPQRAAVEPRAKTRKSSFPDVFLLTDEMRSWANANTPGVDIIHETRQFADHHRARGGQMLRWELAWRTWMRNASHWRKPTTNASKRNSGTFQSVPE